MNLPENLRYNPDRWKTLFSKKSDSGDGFSRSERRDLMQSLGIKRAPEGLKWKYLKSSKELVHNMDLYKEGWTLIPNTVIGINGDEGAGKTQLLYDLAILYGIPFTNVLTGGQTLRRAGERLRKKKRSKEHTNLSVKDQANFIERTDEDDIALDNMQFGWIESPSQEPKAVDSRLIGLAIYSTRINSPDIKAASFYITASENARMIRLSERTGKPVDVVKAETEERRKLDIEWYTRLYKGTKRFSVFGNIINPHNPRYYDYIIDNTHYDRAVALQTMHNHLLEVGLVMQVEEKGKIYDREKDKGLTLATNDTIFP
jgi:cytidylate kinase